MIKFLAALFAALGIYACAVGSVGAGLLAFMWAVLCYYADKKLDQNSKQNSGDATS